MKPPVFSYPADGVGLLSKVLSDYREQQEAFEDKALHPLAARSKDHSRKGGAEEDQRLPYRRDVDRIVHSKAYCRYIDKTQVVYLVDNDHMTKRGLHVQLVSHFSRGIAEILRLNLDLVEAIALGHDVGHPPFGHEGEAYLSELFKEFAHPRQSCRLFSEIEPLNLGLAVLDGFISHDGGMESSKHVPKFGKNWQDHKEDLKRGGRITPMTLEGCLVKLCDTMSYVGRDIEDAISLGLIKREEVPKTPLGTSNREMLGVFSRDLIETSYDKDYIGVSDETFEALKAVRDFNFERIYTHQKLKKESGKIKKAYGILFEMLVAEGKKHPLLQKFLLGKPEKYIEETTDPQMVTDFISGMTDNYFIKTLQKLLIPAPIEVDR